MSGGCGNEVSPMNDAARPRAGGGADSKIGARCRLRLGARGRSIRQRAPRRSLPFSAPVVPRLRGTGSSQKLPRQMREGFLCNKLVGGFLHESRAQASPRRILGLRKSDLRLPRRPRTSAGQRTAPLAWDASKAAVILPQSKAGERGLSECGGNDAALSSGGAGSGRRRPRRVPRGAKALSPPLAGLCHRSPRFAPRARRPLGLLARVIPPGRRGGGRNSRRRRGRGRPWRRGRSGR